MRRSDYERYDKRPNLGGGTTIEDTTTVSGCSFLRVGNVVTATISAVPTGTAWFAVGTITSDFFPPYLLYKTATSASHKIAQMCIGTDGKIEIKAQTANEAYTGYFTYVVRQ